jgi:hypothetical protein
MDSSQPIGPGEPVHFHWPPSLDSFLSVPCCLRGSRMLSGCGDFSEPSARCSEVRASGQNTSQNRDTRASPRPVGPSLFRQCSTPSPSDTRGRRCSGTRTSQNRASPSNIALPGTWWGHRKFQSSRSGRNRNCSNDHSSALGPLIPPRNQKTQELRNPTPARAPNRL